jgi:Sugar kinases, ribokinase family
VDASLCPRSDAPTTLAFVTLSNGQASYDFYDENTAGRMLAPADLPDLAGRASALFLGGISLVSEPCADSFAALCAREHATLPVMLDPNIRPGFIRDEARYRARLAGMLTQADVIKLSDEDLDWLATTPEALLQGGAALVLITRGAEGVSSYGAAGRFDVPAQRATVVDTVGAGDTFNAGFLAGLARDGLLDKARLRAAGPDALRPALALGTQAAAITVSRAGANPPWEHEL